MFTEFLRRLSMNLKLEKDLTSCCSPGSMQLSELESSNWKILIFRTLPLVF